MLSCRSPFSGGGRLEQRRATLPRLLRSVSTSQCTLASRGPCIHRINAGPTSAQRLFALKFIPSRTVTEQQQHHSDSAAQKAKPHGSEAECLSTAVAVAVRCGAAGWSCFSRRDAQPTALRPLHCAIMPAPLCTHSAPDLPHSYAQKHVLICASPEPSFAPSQSRFAVVANGSLLPRFILTLTLIPPFPATAPCPLVAVSRGLSFLLTLHPPPPLLCSPLTVRVL